MATARERLSELLKEAETLKAKGVLSPEENERFGKMLEEGAGLKAQIENETAFDGINQFAGKSTGVPGLASVEGTFAAGESIIETSAGRNGAAAVKMVEQFGEGILSNKAFMATTTPAYKAAFLDYFRYGERALKSDALKTLQEGQDTEGGLIAA